MDLVFVRSGARRYLVEAHREQAADVVMDPAPGYHDFIPHDLVHLVVERHWGLRDGIYGQLAAGGDAHTFQEPGPRSRRQTRRSAAKNRLSGGDAGRSELLAALTHTAWQLRFGERTKPAHDVGHQLAEAGVSERELEQAAEELNILALRWHALPVGGSLRVAWPWPERRTGRRHR